MLRDLDPKSFTGACDGSATPFQHAHPLRESSNQHPYNGLNYPRHAKHPQELEGLEALPAEEWNPLELYVSDETAAAAADTTASPQRSRKRPRSPSSSSSMTFTPRLGQSAGETGGDTDNADNFALSVKRPRTDKSVGSTRGEQAASLWMTQVCTACLEETQIITNGT